ncbi:hypothetical protein BaRGS_00022103 [Batillaria attramentaria]|uniref:Ubiquitin-conjugating enzyme E2 T n=1 Tax=Batillaria attramentaria TaxID=370345 RepID=A0ABD0KI48_9CAEN
MQRIARVKKELQMLTESPPHGISCYPVSDDITHFEAKILGGDGTPYAGGTFKLEIDLPERYPFEPPKVQFLTPIYHPNIDKAGRICLDTLKMPPKGAWKPCLNLVTVLTSIQLLLAQPNPDDALMADIATEFKLNRALFTQKAADYTAQHARDVISQVKQCLPKDLSEECFMLHLHMIADSFMQEACVIHYYETKLGALLRGSLPTIADTPRASSQSQLHQAFHPALLQNGSQEAPSASSNTGFGFLHHSQLPGSINSGKRPSESSHPMQDLTNKKIKS